MGISRDDTAAIAPLLQIRVLGPLEIAARPGTASISSRKSLALIGMLATRENLSMTRDEICHILWGSRGEKQARASLRQELATLKKRLDQDGHVLQTEAERIYLDPECVETDIARLRSPDLPLGERLRLSRGPLLQHLDPREASFDDWILQERNSLDAYVSGLCKNLAFQATDRAEWHDLLAAAENALAISEYDESALRWQLQALAQLGRRAEALDLASQFDRRLRDELGTGLSPETVQLRLSLRGAGEPAQKPDAPEPDEAAVFDRPAVLLLPFDVVGHSEEDSELALGLCEDIRTNLSHWRWFPVIGSEAVTGMSGNIMELGAQVGARYVVKGSLRRVGNQARVVARLISATTGGEIWSAQFDGSISDVFEFQDHTSASIVSQIEPQIGEAENKRLAKARPNRMETWLLLAKAALVERRAGDGYGTQEANLELRAILSDAAESAPDHGEVLARLSRTYFREFLMGWTSDRDAALTRALDLSSRAIELAPDSSLSRAVHAATLLFGKRDPARAKPHAEEAVRLNPSELMGHYMVGCTSVFLGDFDVSYTHYENVLRLNPNFTNKGSVYCDQMMCRALAGKMDEAVELARRVISVAPKYVRGLQRCAAVLAWQGFAEEAADLIAEAERQGGKVSEDELRATYPFAHTEHIDFLVDGMRRAGWVSSN